MNEDAVSQMYLYIVKILKEKYPMSHRWFTAQNRYLEIKYVLRMHLLQLKHSYIQPCCHLLSMCMYKYRHTVRVTLEILHIIVTPWNSSRPSSHNKGRKLLSSTLTSWNECKKWHLFYFLTSNGDWSSPCHLLNNLPPHCLVYHLFNM